MALAGARRVAPRLRERLMKATVATRGGDHGRILRDLTLATLALEARRMGRGVKELLRR